MKYLLHSIHKRQQTRAWTRECSTPSRVLVIPPWGQSNFRPTHDSSQGSAVHSNHSLCQTADDKDNRWPFNRQHQVEHCWQARVTQALAKAGWQNEENIPPRNDVRRACQKLCITLHNNYIPQCINAFRMNKLTY